MAAAAPSPLASSVEKTNGAKLSRLLIDGGTTVLRNVFDGYHPPANLAADLNANYRTLNNLFRKRVLRAAQWDQLFPLGGAAPDSKTFDITLLFLLLTNICGLVPPPSGWHTKPPPSDTSREANLARIKFFRNELYGHVSTTGVDTPTFTSLWLEISAVLVALGLNQAEIDRLKAEHCGEEDYLDVLLDWADSEEDIKSQLKDIRQCQTETQQGVEKVLQTQLEDRKTVEDNKGKLDEVHQTQLEDHEAVQDNKSVLKEIHQTVEGVVTTQEEHSKTLQAVKQTVDSLKEQRDEDRQEDVLRNLAKSEFKGDIEYHVGRFQEGTREWVFNKVKNWLDDRNSQNRAMVISSNAGMGKSVISAVICQRIQEAGRLSGSHFCQHNNARYRNPQLMLQSLACHLCHAVPEYKRTLVNQLSRNLGKDLNNMGVEELFALLFKEPLSIVADPGRNMLMVIDGLDESEYQNRNELLDVIANHFCKLPCWIRFLCTTRPERNIVEALKQLNPFVLEPNEEENVQDIKRFLKNRTQKLMKPGNKGAIVEKLVEKSEGLMLYAYFLVSFLKENMSILDQGDLDGSLPLAISSVYYAYFKRLENELVKELGVKEEQFLNLLCAVTASREPLPVDFISKVLLPSANSPVARRKVLKAIGSVSSLLPIRDGSVHVFHKSVNDWLTDISCYGEHVFTVDEKEGHRILASLCADELDDLKQRGAHDAQLSTAEKYALHHGVRHLLLLDENMKSGSLEKCVQTYVIDLELLYAKLCVSDSLAAEDILWLQRMEISQVLSENIKELLNTLIFLLRKYFNTITNHPYALFQTVLNNGGTVLSSVASNLLQNKYPEIPYMEFVHKEMRQGAVLGRFQCSSQVACFDVSPQLNYLVCECYDRTIHLWSLHTGKLVWKHPALVKKPCILFPEAVKRSQSSPVFSLYRSVVFHPTTDVVLPGVLSHAYTFNGDLKPFFPESSCRFTICSISGDKTKMLTDCPDDAKCIMMWSLENGSEIARITKHEDVLTFAWSRDEKLLAISHPTGFISIVDVMDGFRTIAEIVVPEVCGMIKFSPDCRSLSCMHADGLVYLKNRKIFRFNINMEKLPSCTLNDCESDVPLEFESQSEAGFLLGDPISFGAFDFVYNEETVLRGYLDGSFIDMLNVYERHKTDREAALTMISDIVFSLSGETVYVVGDADMPTVSAWNISSMKLIGQKSRHTDKPNLVVVKEGVLFTTANGSLELWNFELSKCVRSWTNVSGITKMMPISEERVACEAGKKVTILDTTSGEFVSTFPIRGYRWLVTCNSKCQLLTFDVIGSIELLDGSITLWKEIFPLASIPLGMFSLSEQFVVIWAPDRYRVYVLNALSGKHCTFYLKPIGLMIVHLSVTRNVLSVPRLPQETIVFSCLTSSLVTC